jgi:hypothetical protein
MGGPAIFPSKKLVCSSLKIATCSINSLGYGPLFHRSTIPPLPWPFLHDLDHTIRDRKGSFRVNDWMMDSGGFTGAYA